MAAKKAYPELSLAWLKVLTMQFLYADFFTDFTQTSGISRHSDNFKKHNPNLNKTSRLGALP